MTWYQWVAVWIAGSISVVVAWCLAVWWAIRTGRIEEDSE